MMKEKIVSNLEKLNFNFSETNDEIIVRLDYSHNVFIKISENNKIIISDKLVHWNFLTGGIPMSLKNAMLYIFCGILVFAILCIYFSKQASVFNTDLFLAFGIWVLLFTGYYTVKLESFKQQLAIWTNM